MNDKIKILLITLPFAILIKAFLISGRKSNLLRIKFRKEKLIEHFK